MATAKSIYEDDAVDCVKAFHMWQLNTPTTGHVVPYDIWRSAWLAAEKHIKEQQNGAKESKTE